jgi:mRNA interferase RelE/StbE
MSYEVLILRRAQKELAALTKVDFERVRGEVLSLADHPRPAGCRKLVGRDGWRVRVGSYRVIYQIDDEKQQVTVLHVGHRRDVYE